MHVVWILKASEFACGNIFTFSALSRELRAANIMAPIPVQVSGASWALLQPVSLVSTDLFPMDWVLVLHHGQFKLTALAVCHSRQQSRHCCRPPQHRREHGGAASDRAGPRCRRPLNPPPEETPDSGL